MLHNFKKVKSKMCGSKVKCAALEGTEVNGATKSRGRLDWAV